MRKNEKRNEDFGGEAFKIYKEKVRMYAIEHFPFFTDDPKALIKNYTDRKYDPWI